MPYPAMSSPWAGMTTQDRLAVQTGLEGFWDTVYNVADTVKKGVEVVRQVKAGNATVITQTGSGGTTVSVAPTPKGFAPWFAQSDIGKSVIIGGVALVAVLLLTRRR
jgi:hypothetical protein